MMSSVATKLIPHQHNLRTLSPHVSSITSLLSSQTITQPSSKFFHTSTIVQRRPREDRDPKIKITLEQLRMAARGSGRRAPICHDQQEKVMNSLEAANYEVRWNAVLIFFRHNAAYFNSLIYKYIIEYDKCREDYEKNHKGKDKSMMRELNKYLVRRRKNHGRGSEEDPQLKLHLLITKHEA
eukprot:scaffold9747_cov125-Skeletonema_dohrnii-CCMP3373.AAC.9